MISPGEIKKIKSCQHLNRQKFVDQSFSGLGVMCKDCRVILEWLIEPDEETNVKQKKLEEYMQ